MPLNSTFELANGLHIPRLGLGTWKIPDDTVAESVHAAVACGYRHIDTAQAYGNERGVGEGIRTCGVPREDIFVTSKLAAEIKTYDESVEAIQGSVEKLGLGPIDLMLIHCPQPWAEFGDEDRYFEGNRQAWRALEEAYEAGTVRSIGVSNFEEVDLENIFEVCSVRPMVNQILTHVGHTPEDLIDFCEAHEIVVEAYSPIAHGRLLQHAELEKMAAKYGVSVPQLAIRYTLQLGLVSLPKSSNPDHIRSNANVDFEISGEDMDALRVAS